jgi:cobalt-zinc-cadmium efflux system outer membrane protein
MTITRYLTLSFAIAALAHTSAADAKKTFAEVRETVAKATGRRVHWLRTGEEHADSAAQVAMLNNRSLQARFEELGISFADYIEAILPANPRFFASFRFPDSPPSASNIEYSIAEDLLSLLLLPAKRKLAVRELEIAKQQAAADVLGLIADTKAALYTVQARQQLLGRLQLIVETNEAGAELSKRLHDAGNITDLDLANQEALYAQSRVAVGQTQAQIRTDRERLNRLMGAWGTQTRWTISGELPAIPAREVSLDGLESKAIAQRVDIAAAREEVDSLGLALTLKQKTRWLPGGVNVGGRAAARPVRAGPQ